MAKVKIEIEALNQKCAECPYIEIEKERYYQDGICCYNKLLCTRLPICSQALITAQKEDDNYGN